MELNISKKIRELIESGINTRPEIIKHLGGEMTKAKFHGHMKHMIGREIISRSGEGDAATYSVLRTVAKTGVARTTELQLGPLPYTIDEVDALKEKLDYSVRQRSQLIRQAIKLLPMRPAHVSRATGISRRHVTGTLSDMASRGYVKRLGDGRYEFVKNPRNEALAKIRQLNAASVPTKQADTWASQPGETVEEFLARGGQIDYSATVVKFENLTHEEIIGKSGVVPMGYQSPMQRSFTQGY